MAIDFPNSPTNGETYVAGGKTWIYNSSTSSWSDTANAATYSISAETATGGANLRLTGSDTTTDDVKIGGSGSVTVSRTDANTITVSGTDTVYTLPAATSTVLGGVELFSDTTQSVAANAVSSTASRTYGLQVNASGQGVINVPWTDNNTTYSVSAETVTGGANLRLTGSNAVTDDVKIQGSGLVTITRTDANTINVDANLDVVFNQQTASYTIVLSDKNKMIEVNSASINDIIIPLDSTTNFPTGAQVNILQTGSGQTTIVGTSGVTVAGTPGLKLRAQWSAATLIKRAADSWVVIGDLSE